MDGRRAAFRRWAAGGVIACLATVFALAGCGTKFDLPTERKFDRPPATDKSYQMIATWPGMDGVTDVLLTQGGGSQLFLLFNHGGTGTGSRGEVRAYPLTRPSPIAGIDFRTLFNPVALCAASSHVYVLDQGDSCIARSNPAGGGCSSDGGWTLRVTDLGHYWRVREYGLLGGDTISTFTDTSMAFVNGVAADDNGFVYVSGIAIILVPDIDPRFRTRTFLSRIYRYARGPRYPGIEPPDRNMPGANWHRDTTWVVEEGSGVGTLLDPRGMDWSPAGGSALYSTDLGNARVQRLSVALPNTGFFALDGGQSGQLFNNPVDVSVDLEGFIYITDNGNQRVLRYGPDQTYVQRVDVEPNASGQPLLDPVAAAANDSVVYVADRGRGEVIRYQRRR